MDREEAVEFTVSGDTTASEGVLSAVATAERADPIDLTPPLYSVVDPEALDALVRSLNGEAGWIEFVYRGKLVTVDGAGGVRVQPQVPEEEDGT